MSNPLYYLFALVLALAYPTGVEPLRFADDPGAAAAASIGAVLLVAAVSGLAYRRIRNLRRLYRLRTAIRAAALLLFAALVHVFHLPLLVWRIEAFEELPLLGDLILLIPFFGMMGVHALGSTPADVRLRGGEATTRGLLSFGWRTFLGFSLFPVLLMLTLQSALDSWMPMQKLGTIYPFATWLVALGLITLFLAGAPLYLRAVFRARPIPAGPKRTGLEAIAARAGFRCRELLLLDTADAGVANAFIVGLHPRLRYVFFTDRLYQGLEGSELECVMAHEMSHALRRHIPFYLFFTVAFLTLLLGLSDLFGSAAAPGIAVAAGALASAFLAWVILFGFVSRRFETEADLAGMRIADGAARFAGALYRVADLNRIPPDVGSWRHWSIARRCGLLLRAEGDPDFARRFERTCGAIRAACFVAFLCGLAYFGVSVRRQIARAPQARRDWEVVEKAFRGFRLVQDGKTAEAIPYLEESTRHESVRGELFLVLAEAYERVGRAAEAEAARRKAVERGVTDPRYRLKVR